MYVDSLNPFLCRTFRRLLAEFLADETNPAQQSKPKEVKNLPPSPAPPAEPKPIQSNGLASDVQELINKQMQKQNELLSRLQQTMDVPLPTIAPWEKDSGRIEQEFRDTQQVSSRKASMSDSSSHVDSPLAVNLPPELMKRSHGKMGSEKRLARLVDRNLLGAVDDDEGSLYSEDDS